MVSIVWDVGVFPRLRLRLRAWATPCRRRRLLFADGGEVRQDSLSEGVEGAWKAADDEHGAGKVRLAARRGGDLYCGHGGEESWLSLSMTGVDFELGCRANGVGVGRSGLKFSILTGTLRSFTPQHSLRPHPSASISAFSSPRWHVAQSQASR